MDSKEENNADGDRRHMAAENSDTVALNKKRVHRVSFAEMTSVYFFDRNEEFNETSQVETAKMVDDSPTGFRLRGLSERGKVFAGEDDGGDSLEDEIMEMQRLTLEALDKKILTLTRIFHSCCKLKAEPGVGETITMVTEQLAKKTPHRFIRLDTQVRVVQGMTSLNGQHNVILNHLDLIIQSIRLIVGPKSSVRSSFKLNETNITKNFPNMDACIALWFVFNAETAHKYVGTKTLVPSLLLGSLLDVVEEVQTAQTEFQNLTLSSFSPLSVVLYALQLRILWGGSLKAKQAPVDEFLLHQDT
ncbi:hypothetical protein SASPL_124470 [Salvia splendens]|uniref:Uncharacterized protein n=1 Tax=Salvia splendens TaxID=180675 RepID=A0A8X8ZV01_SALSN|nr:hypothetical protein SASPL_124470 [Salvia splendens]